jgi:lysozyme family protein
MSSKLIALSNELRAEYDKTYIRAYPLPSRTKEVNAVAAKVEANKARYEAISAATGVPWQVIGAIHMMETGGRFSRHLHNGDPLTERTVHEPKRRPKTGEPPFTFEQSAIDALCGHGLHQWHDWSIPGALYVIERYNGWGYRMYHPETPTPYLWSFSTVYHSGKYASDGQWDPKLESKQCGAAMILKALKFAGIE